MRPRLTERSEHKSMSEFDPTPRYIEELLRSNWVWGSIRTYHLRRSLCSVSDVPIEERGIV